MILREHYLNPIRSFYDSDLIKIITGIRRCGKSVLLKQAYSEIRSQGKDALFLDFDLKPVRNQIPDADALIEYVKNNRQDGICYIFLDEVQNVTDWSEACRTLRLQNCSVFISGSNSKLLSGEFTKELSGRYVSFRIRPFVYREAKEYCETLGKDLSITDYIVWGGFPATFDMPDIESKKRYLSDLNDTIIYNDLENRYKIKKTDIFEKMVDYVLVSNARIFSAQSVTKYMNGQGIQISTPTVIKYLSYLKEAYVINEVAQYSRKTKSKMSYYQKLYDEDVSLNSIRCIGNRFDLTHNFENIVLNELLYMGYEITVYNNSGREIDFRAEKDNKVYLVQVAYSVAEDKAYDREFSAFAGIDNLVKKIIITNDDLDYSTSTVHHCSFKEFVKLNSLDEI